MERGVGEGAAVRAVVASDGSRRPIELVAHEDPVADEVEGLGGDALVIDRDGGEAMLVGAVAGDVHHARAVDEGAQLVRRRERRARIGRLVAERAVELRGVADRLMDREPQVGGIDHQVIATSLDRWRGELLGEERRQCLELGCPVPPFALHVLPAATDRWGDRPHRLEAALGVGLTASSWGCTRTRRCEATVPAKSA